MPVEVHFMLQYCRPRAGCVPRNWVIASASVISMHALPTRSYKSHRVALRKQLGQHLLKNPDVVKKIVEAAKVQPHELVLEIGPGTGNMTIPLLKQSRGVFAVELDPNMHEAVTARVRHL